MKIYDDLKEARRHYNPKKKYYKELIAIPSSNTGGTSWNTDCYIEVIVPDDDLTDLELIEKLVKIDKELESYNTFEYEGYILNEQFNFYFNMLKFMRKIPPEKIYMTMELLK